LEAGALIKVIVNLADQTQAKGKERIVIVREKIVEAHALLYAAITLTSLSAAGLGTAIYFNISFANQPDDRSYLARAGVVSYVVAGVLGASALTCGLIYVFGDHKTMRRTRLNLSAFVSPSLLALGATGRF